MANWYDNIPTPVDSNGREVPLGTKELVLDGKVFEVGCLAYHNVECAWVVDLVGFASKVPLGYCTLRDSWERLEEDAVKDACEYFGYGDDSIYNKYQSCPAYGDDCGPAMALDLVRRAKALAGVTDSE